MDQRIKKLHVTRYTLHVTGLTLIEVVVSLGVLMVGLGATTTLIVSSLAHSQRNEQAIVVTNLAREGVEIIRSIRDQMDQGFAGVQEGAWAVDGLTTSLTIPASVSTNLSLANCTTCKLHLVNGRYMTNTAAGSATPYNRAVQVADVNPNIEKKLVSIVEWTEHGRTHQFQLEERLFNWR